MPITNGIDTTIVLPVLKARRGWQQPTSSDFTPVLDTASKKCLSGRYYNMEHPSCTANSIWRFQEDPAISDANFNAYLDALKAEVCLYALNQVFVSDAIIELPSIIWEKQFRTGFKPITNSAKFCGYQLKIFKSQCAVKIDSIGLNFTGPCTVTLYLFNDMKADPLWSHEFAVTKADDQQWFRINTDNYTEILLRYQNEVNKGGVYWLGYFQDEIDAQNVRANDVYLVDWTQYAMVGWQTFEATSDYEAETFVRDIYTSNYRTYGMNLEISSCHDYSNSVISQPQAFDNLLGLMMQDKCVSEVVNSNRVNKDNRMSDENFSDIYSQQQALDKYSKSPYDPSAKYKTGFVAKIQNEIKRIQATFFDDSPVVIGVPPVNTSINVNHPTWGMQI